MSRWRLAVPAAAALAGELLAHLVPDLLGVEQDAVEVEDDGVDHAIAGIMHNRRRADTSGGGPVRFSSSARARWAPRSSRRCTAATR